MPVFLLELRTEEIPANALPGARRQLEDRLGAALAENGFEDTRVACESTSRRLAVTIHGLPERQPDREERVMGPPARVAFDADGEPTRAAEGFARKVGAGIADLERVSTDKGEYLAAVVRHTGRPTAEILAEIVPEAVRGLHFPKVMRWGLGRHLFVRPIHGVVALLDAEVVPLEIFGVAAVQTTVGHRVHSPEVFEVESATAYAGMLRERKVLIDPAERRAMLEEEAARLAAEEDCRVHPDEALVAEHVELVEYPGLIRGRFDEAFLELPSEVVVTTLRHHQKCLILETAEGRLAPHFLAVIDRMDDPLDLIRQGNEWVIGARLADARFFFQEDCKRPLASLVPELDRLELHRVLGSLGEKARRVGTLAVRLGEAVGSPAAASDLERAAALVKADLVTNMVGEFPELQGIMGGHYLRRDGEPEEIWTAARDHYRPTGFEGEIPSSETGRIIGVADRLDTLAGLFAVDEIPTGSRDPFGLRRAAQGVVKIVAEAAWDLDLAAAISWAAEGVAGGERADATEVSRQVMAFVEDRVRRYLTDRTKVAGDTADAVMGAGWTRLPALIVRAEALEAARVDPAFRTLALAFKRVRNITEGQPDAEVEPGLFQEDAEATLYREALAFHEILERELAEGHVEEAFAAMGRLAGTLETFFVDVLVMAEDDGIRMNRIALLKLLRRDFLKLADLARLQVEGSER